MESTMQETIAKFEAIYKDLGAIDPEQSLLSLRKAVSLDGTEELAAWMKTMNLGKKKKQKTSKREGKEQEQEQEQEPETEQFVRSVKKEKRGRGGTASDREKKGNDIKTTQSGRMLSQRLSS
jgi:hypothetical protein